MSYVCLFSFQRKARILRFYIDIIFSRARLWVLFFYSCTVFPLLFLSVSFEGVRCK